MAFEKKEWKDRVSEFPSRRKLTKTNGTSEVVTVSREAEGIISQEGDAFSAANMNDLENRIVAATNEATVAVEQAFSDVNNWVLRIENSLGTQVTYSWTSSTGTLNIVTK